MTKNDKENAALLRKFMKVRNQSSRNVAKEIGGNIHYSTIQRYEREETPIPDYRYDQFKRVFKEFGFIEGLKMG